MPTYSHVPIATHSSCDYPNCPHHAHNKDLRVSGVIRYTLDGTACTNKLADARRFDIAREVRVLMSWGASEVLVLVVVDKDWRLTEGQVAWMQAGMPDGVRVVPITGAK